MLIRTIISEILDHIRKVYFKTHHYGPRNSRSLYTLQQRNKTEAITSIELRLQPPRLSVLSILSTEVRTGRQITYRKVALENGSRIIHSFREAKLEFEVESSKAEALLCMTWVMINLFLRCMWVCTVLSAFSLHTDPARDICLVCTGQHTNTSCGHLFIDDTNHIIVRPPGLVGKL